MSYCRSCGGPLTDQNRFCPRCGTPNPDFIDVNQPKKSNTALLIGLSCLGAVIIGVVVFFIVYQLSSKGSDKPVAQTEVVAGNDVSVADSVATAVAPAIAPVVEESKPVVREKTYENGLYGENINMKGTIDGYPVTFEFKISRGGDVSGRYSYDSTIRKYGKKASNYFKINGTLYDDGSRMDIVDYLPKDSYPHHNMELWVSQRGSHFDITGTIYNNTNGEVYNLHLKK